MKKQTGNSVAALLIYLVLVLGIGAGWVLNVVKIVQNDFAPITGMLIARIIGVFIAPLGAVLGYF